MKKVVAALVLTSFAGAVFAQQGLKPEEMIKYPQGRLQLHGVEHGQDQGQPGRHLQQGAGHRGRQRGRGDGQFGHGRAVRAGDRQGCRRSETRVKPEFFKEQDKVRELAMAYIKEANELQKVAATGDAAAVKVQFGKTGESCKACHDKYRKDDCDPRGVGPAQPRLPQAASSLDAYQAGAETGAGGRRQPGAGSGIDRSQRNQQRRR
jgi:hypothetical protein